ncbi:MAG: hypothetical protein LBJ96_04110 [Holosporaceae bacterium]|jgi:hypothetical protein|nr:hypothetical protein [Holosporaceae bacterium]
MHKIRIYVLLFFIITLIVLCIFKAADLVELKNREEYLAELQININNLAREIEKTSFNCLKSKEKLFAPKSDVKKDIEKFAKKLNLKKVLIKRDSTQNLGEVKIFTNREQEIYNFINELFFELPGIVHFKSIKLSPVSKEEIAAFIQFSSATIAEPENLIFLKTADKKYDSINLFKKTKIHQLFCAINALKVYIDDSWFKIGDRIDDCIIEDIGQNFIHLRKDSGDKICVKLGSRW